MLLVVLATSNVAMGENTQITFEHFRTTMEDEKESIASYPSYENDYFTDYNGLKRQNSLSSEIEPLNPSDFMYRQSDSRVLSHVITSDFPVPLSLTPSDPIVITSNADFALQAAANSWAGDGSSSDPYVISDLHIDVTNETGIDIQNTDVYFVINNCLIEKATDSNTYGIYFDWVENGRIINSIIRENYYGISISRGVNIEVSNNVVANNSYGMDLFWSEGAGPSINVTDNTFVNNGFLARPHVWNKAELLSATITGNTVNAKAAGYYVDLDSLEINTPAYGQIFLAYVNNSVIQNQVINATDNGIYAVHCNNITISHNEISNSNGDGIFLNFCTDVAIKNNGIDGATWNGISIFHSTNIHVFSNTVENAYRGLYLSGTNQHVLFEENYFADNNAAVTIYGGGISNNMTFYKNTVNNCKEGMWLFESIDVLFLNNTIQAVEHHGLYVGYTTDVAIYNNTVKDGYVATAGMHGGIAVYGSSQIDIVNNTVYSNENKNGIVLFLTEDINISKNILYENYAGIRLENSTAINVEHNTIYDHRDDTTKGILLYYSDYNYIAENNYQDNWDSVHLIGSSYNLFYNNTISAVSLSGLKIGFFPKDGSFYNNFTYNYLEDSSATKGLIAFSEKGGYNTIFNNTIINCYTGIDVDHTSVYAFNNHIEVATNGYGVSGYFGFSHFGYNTIIGGNTGMRFITASGTHIYQNSIIGADRGISLSTSSHSNTISTNLIKDCTSYGIIIESAWGAGNMIYLNNFVNNGISGFDNSTTSPSTWYISDIEKGNYWDDWTSGFYLIDGEANTADYYPLTAMFSDLEKPVFSNIAYTVEPFLPDDPLEYELGSLRFNITATDNTGIYNPYYYDKSITFHIRVNDSSYWESFTAYRVGSMYYIDMGIGWRVGLGDKVDFYFVAYDYSYNKVYSNITTFIVEDTTPPVMKFLTMDPLEPSDNQTISFTAQVNDATGVKNVSLYYRLDNGTWTSAEMTVEHWYTVTIGPLNGSFLEYYLWAVDHADNVFISAIFSANIIVTVSEFSIHSSLIFLATLTLGSSIFLLVRRRNRN